MYAHRSLLLPLVAFSAACYRYAPVTEPVVSPGTHVRLGLIQQGEPALRSVLGEGTIAVEGQVVGASDSVYNMAIAATLKKGAMNIPSRIVWSGESVTIPRASVSGVERRSLDRGRTTRAIAIATVAALVSVKLIVSAAGSSSGGDDGGVVVTPP